MQRRTLLVGIAAASTTPASAQLRLLSADDLAAAQKLGEGAPKPGTPRVLFVGNSFTYEHDIPARVAALAAAEGPTLKTAMLVEGGARLAGTLAKAGVAAMLADTQWDAVILQDHSTTALDPAYRADSAAAIRFAARLVAPTPVLVVTPWARAEGHPLYGSVLRDGIRAPDSPLEMMQQTNRFFADTATLLSVDEGLSVRAAVVAMMWHHAIEAGATLHAADGYHANEAGADLTAQVIWDALSLSLPEPQARAPG